MFQLWGDIKGGVEGDREGGREGRGEGELRLRMEGMRRRSVVETEEERGSREGWEEEEQESR